MPESVLFVIGGVAVILLMLVAARLRARQRDGAAVAARLVVDPTDRDALRALLAEHLSSDAARAIDGLILPSIRALSTPAPQEALGAGASRIGGVPHLPTGCPWPDRNGMPLAFLAQINCADLPDLDGDSPLPREGTLWFFYDALEQPWGFDPADRGSWKVIYDHGDPAALAPASPPDGLTAEDRFHPCRLRFRPEFTIPPAQCPPVDALALPVPDVDHLVDVTDATASADPEPRNRLLGHPDPIQSGDIQVQCQLASHGVHCGRRSDVEEQRAQELARASGDWVLLLQLDSQNDMMWGDVGRLYFHVRADDLRVRRFDGVWMVLQCS